MVFKVSEEELEEAMRQNEINDAKPKKTGCCSSACQKIMKLSCSHVGLCILLTLYCVGGAFMFIAIEKSNQEDVIDEHMMMSEEVLNETQRVKEILKKYWNISEKPFGLKGQLPYEHFAKAFEGYTAYMDDSIANRSYIGTIKVEDRPETDWNFPSCLLFTVSTVTAIGYGHIAPKTEDGQVVTILYCLVGIPLTLIFLANVGEALALGIRWLWGKVSGYKRQKDEVNEDGEIEEIETKEIPVPIVLTIGIFCLYVLIGTIVFKFWEDWSLISSLYFILASLTTIGFGDLVPGWHNSNNLSGQFQLAFSSVYIVFGLAFLSMAFSLIIEKVSTAAKSASLKLRKQEMEEEEFE